MANEVEYDQYLYAARDSTKSDKRGEKLHFDASAASVFKPQASIEDVDETQLASKMRLQGFVPTTKVKKDLRNTIENPTFQQKSTPKGQ